MPALTLLFGACAPSDLGLRGSHGPASATPGSTVAAPDVADAVEDIDAIVRAERSDTGTPAPVTETFTYARPKVDLLLIVDNSSSMKQENQDLADAIAPTVASWQTRGFDYHAGVVDIDANDWQGTLEDRHGVRWADETVADPTDLLTHLVTGVPDYSSDEAGRRAAWLALQFATDDGANAGFLRPDAELDIVVHSDDDDASGDDPPLADFIAYLQGLRPDPALLHFHAISPGPEYTAVTDAVGGVSWAVDDTPYAPALDAVTDMFHRTDVFPLAAPADPMTVAVSVDDLPLPTTNFRYDPDTHTVDLGGLPPRDGARVSVTYVPVGP